MNGPERSSRLNGSPKEGGVESATPVIEARAVSKTFGSITAVDGLSISIRAGEVFGLLGPNGAGKTTTIRMLNGILTPDTGKVLIDGQLLAGALIGHKLRMGVVPEHSNVYGDLSAFQNLVLTGKFYGYRKELLRERALELLDRFDLRDRKNEPVRTYSKGMQQRVGIASALIHDPEILFLDEPTSGLDVKSQRLIKETIRERSRAGSTIVLTTHNIEEANSLCDRVCIINQGKLIVIDSPENLKKTYDSVQSVEFCIDRAITPSALRPYGEISHLQKIGDKWKLYTSDPDRLVKHLVGWAEREAVSIRTLNINQASLEDVFIALTEE